VNTYRVTTTAGGRAHKNYPYRSVPTLDGGRYFNNMVLTPTKVIDGRGHLLGRLCSIVARELLAGQTIVLVRCDEICISGSCKCALSTSADDMIVHSKQYPTEQIIFSLLLFISISGPKQGQICTVSTKAHEHQPRPWSVPL
jgi:hypothetical protein